MIYKKYSSILFLLVTLVIFSGCQQNENSKLSFDEQEEHNYNEAIKVVDKYFSSIMKGNYDMAFDLTDPEALLIYEDGTKMDSEKFTQSWKEEELTKFEIFNEGVIKYKNNYVVQTKLHFVSGEIIILPCLVQEKEKGFLLQASGYITDGPPYVQPFTLMPNKNEMQY